MKHLLSSTAFIVLNKQLARQVGLKEAILLAYQQRKCIKTLKEKGLIEVKRKGIPAKQYFKINEEQVLQILNNLSDKNPTTINKNKEIRITNKYFKKPHVFDIKNYCLERKNNVDCEAFWDFYESKDWFVGKSKMKCWKSAVRNWERGDKKKPQTMSKLDSQINQYEQAKKLL